MPNQNRNKIGYPPYPPDAPRFTSHTGSAVVEPCLMRFLTYGDPFPMPRPKVGRGRSTSKFARYHTYVPSNSNRKAFIDALNNALTGHDIPPAFLTNQVHVNITFYFSRPRSHFDNLGEIKSSNTSPRVSAKKADVDNCLKFVLDCCQGLVIGDDHLVEKVVVEKRWSNACVQVDGAYIGVGCTAFEISLAPLYIDPPVCPFSFTSH